MWWRARAGAMAGKQLVIHKLVSQETGANQYLLISGGQGALIDADNAAGETGRLLEADSARLCYILATHAHPSNVRSVKTLQDRYGGRFCIHEYDEELLGKAAAGITPDRLLKDNIRLPLGDLRIRVLHTPGHTKGSVSYWIREAGALFTGSTLLKGTHGRIWGPKSMSLMLFSLKRIGYTVPAETRVYPGRGEETRISREGWIQCLRSA